MKIKFLSILAVAALFTACGPSEEDTQNLENELNSLMENLDSKVEEAIEETTTTIETAVDSATTTVVEEVEAAH